MKKMLVLLSILLNTIVLLAQTDAKNDVILKTNGDEMIGKVLEIADAVIKFSYKGESLIYEVKKSEIIKITFASGRIEFYNRPSTAAPTNNAASNQPVAANTSLLDHHNKVAILPFGYLIDKQDAGESLTYQVQNETFSFLSKHSGVLELQAPNTTNALLIKAGVNNGNLRGFTMGEICNILGVEFIIQGAINQSSTGASTFGSSSSTIKGNGSTVDNKNGTVIGKLSGSSYGYSTTTKNYKTSVNMNVYNDKGETLFSQDHESFWSSDDAYKVTLQYLLKRTPLYKK